MNPNPEQIKVAVRWLVTAFGASLAGWLAHSGYVTTGQVMDALNSPAFMSAAVAVVSGIFGLWAHTQKNAAAVVARIAEDPASPVAGVVTSNTPEGRALAASLPHDTIASAGTVAATNIANDNVQPGQKVA